jgi:hypothetical protein
MKWTRVVWLSGVAIMAALYSVFSRRIVNEWLLVGVLSLMAFGLSSAIRAYRRRHEEKDGQQ